jgi:NHL repeat
VFIYGGVAVDGSGNLFIADTSNSRVRLVQESARQSTPRRGSSPNAPCR